MTRSARLLVPLALAGVSAAPADSPSPDDLIRQGNAAFAAGDPDRAGRCYAAAAERTNDPGLIAFNTATVLFGKGEFRDAELYYQRVLDDRVIPADRRARALFNRGVCLLKQGDDVGRCRSAVACFEQAADAHTNDPTLAADARHNLEVAKLLWDQARRKDKSPPRPDQTPQDVPETKPPTPPAASSDPGSDPAGNPGTRAKPTGPDIATPPSADQSPRPTDQHAAGAGKLSVLPDTDRVEPLSPDDTRAYLLRAAARLEQDRRSNARRLAGPERPNVRDW